MKRSPKRFRAHLRDALLDLHWRQWCALGVAGQVEPERHWVVDLEALAASTLTAVAEDRRLAGFCRDWLAVNGRLLNGARLRRISTEFRAAGLPSAPARSRLARAGQARLKMTSPVLTLPVLLQLRLRALFGIDARADVFCYLLYNDSGNSSSIARVLRLHQKSVYEVLERWAEAGVVQRLHRGYALNPEAVPPSVREVVSSGMRWLDWTSVYRALGRLLAAMAAADTNDPYIASSLFRDVQPEFAGLAHSLGLRLPPAGRYPAAEYFGPFAKVVSDILSRLGSGTE